MTTRKLNQTPPDRARDLFDKLLATSDSAIKTRERLFDDLQEELKLLATLQEQHLLPILRRHGMDDLVRQALSDNEETTALLTELERMPKSNAEFLAKVADLKRVFQQHIRDDRKELLPAVLKVLSDDEAEAVIEKVEDEVAAIDESKRTEARRTREQADAVQRPADNLAETVRAGTESAQNIAQSMQRVVESGFDALSEMARRSSGQALQMFGPSVAKPQGLGEQVSDNVKSVVRSNTVLTQGIQELSREWFELSQKRLQTNLDGLNALTRCQSVNDLVTVQSSLIRNNLEQTVDNSRRIAELTMRLADEATRSVTVGVKQFADRVGRPS